MRVVASTLTSRWLIAAIGGLAAILTLSPDPRVGAQNGYGESQPGTMYPLIVVQHGQELVAIHQDQFTRVAPPEGLPSSLVTADISASFVVNYTGFTPQAQAAFQYAVDIWSNIVTSSVPIVINANWTALGPGILGSAGPTFIHRDFAGAPEANTWYPAAIANAIVGMDLSPGPTQNEINANFSSAFPNWYFGTDGNTPGGQFDFVSVVLHEIGHGLGFVGSAQVAGSFGGWGLSGGFPLSYDRRIVNGSVQNIINTALFPNPSMALAVQLQSNNLFWNGTAGVAGNGGIRPKIYAPATWAAGSSYSHLDDATYPAGDPNSLMTHAIGTAEAIHNPGPIVRGIFTDIGWLIAPPCTYLIAPISATVAAAGVTGATVAVTTGVGCAWTAVSNAGFVAVAGGASGNGNGTVTYNVSANGAAFRSGTVTIAGQPFTVNQTGVGPTMSLDKASLNFGAATNGSTFTAKTPGQQVRMTQAGAGSVSWTATPSHPWITVSPGSGSGSTVFTINIVPDLSLPPLASQLLNDAIVNGVVNLAFTGAGNGPASIAIRLNLVATGTTTAPQGNIDTPANNATGLVGAVGFTGWAIDDMAVAATALCRDAVGGEMAPVDPRCGGAAKIYVGDAVSIDGARPDVAAAFPTFPQNTQAGWGFMVLTNMLPNQGNGTYVFSVYISDVEGNVVLLGSRTITCNNLASILPFGTLDTPGQGAVASGSAYFNFGWALTPQPKIIPFDGSTIVVFVDGVPVGTPSYNHFRADIASLFPGLANTDGAIGVRTLDTTTMANGLHTIAWSVTDNLGAATGIGSRFFTVSNGASLTTGTGFAEAWFGESAKVPASAAFVALDPLEVNALPIVRGEFEGRHGWDLDAPFDTLAIGRSGRTTVQAEALSRVELRLSETGKGKFTGFVRVGSSLTPLPVGSHLDPATGAFTWSPGVGFVGSYDLVFVRWSGQRPISRREVRVILRP